MANRKPSWDDREWEQVWDQLLGPAERHQIMRDVWFGRLPEQPFERRVAIEFARRWRRRAIWLSLLWFVWVGYWMLSLVGELTWATHTPPPSYPYVMALVGVLGVVACLHGRRRILPVAVTPEGPR
ncbi:hypothetical protein ER308_01115 [Egibacter rhizosphaerae]|uniref:Uncharacterized protein n=1 Tax=Egibacter rhizosphaerae TaxID=1670831 RepID=A0A411YAV1_9ACTN|nr:hypothetical protein [Egibacter rhizosphaerae]QBI18307.1 hypothetical protein ER308_01115 [Egibacter rhizosphaerae]